MFLGGIFYNYKERVFFFKEKIYETKIKVYREERLVKEVEVILMIALTFSMEGDLFHGTSKYYNCVFLRGDTEHFFLLPCSK